MHILNIGPVQIEIWPEVQHLRATFPDGAQLSASPQDTAAYRALAEELGYGDNTWLMCLHHEVLHQLLARSNGESYSMALYRAATNQPATQLDYTEEHAVLFLQRMMNLSGGSHAGEEARTLNKEAENIRSATQERS